MQNTGCTVDIQKHLCSSLATSSLGSPPSGLPGEKHQYCKRSVDLSVWDKAACVVFHRYCHSIMISRHKHLGPTLLRVKMSNLSTDSYKKKVLSLCPDVSSVQEGFLFCFVLSNLNLFCSISSACWFIFVNRDYVGKERLLVDCQVSTIPAGCSSLPVPLI